MRVLLLTLDYPPSPSSTGVLMRQLAAELGRRGHRVTVIASAVPESAGVQAETDDAGVTVRRVRVLGPRLGDSASGRLLNFASFNARSLFDALAVGRQDVVIAVSPPFTSGLVSWMLGRLRRIPSIYIVQDFQTEAYVQFGVLRNRWLIRGFRALERFACAANTRVVVIADSFRKYLVERGVTAGRISVIPNFVDVQEIRPLDRDNGFARREGLADRFIVMHAGSISFRHGVELILDAAKLLRDIPDITFVIVGGGSKQAHLEDRLRDAQLSNVRLLPFQPRRDLPAMRAAADIHLIVLRRGMTIHSVPCKVYEIMASERPFVAAIDRGSEIDRIAAQTGAGIVVEPESAEALAAAIRQLHRDPVRRVGMGHAGRKTAVSSYDVGVVANSYEMLLRELAGVA